MKFEKISAYKDIDLRMPVRATKNSAGYDLAAAEDIIIPSAEVHMDTIWQHYGHISAPFTLQEMADITKKLDAKPTLVPTGMKCKLDKGKYLELSVRSSTPLKYWLVLANGVGIIDGDYYNNRDNEGHIFLQFINLSSLPIQIKRGDIIGQGIIKSYYTTEDDVVENERLGGFGSTSNNG